MMKLFNKSKFILVTMILGVTLLLLFAQGVSAQDITLSASSVSGNVGENVTVTISINNAEGTTGGQFDLSYGPTMAGAPLMLEPVSAARGSFVPDVSGNLFDYNLQLEGNKIRVLWVTAEGATNVSGVVGTVVFRILAEGETNLTFSDWIIDDPRIGRMVATPVAGKVTGLSPGDVTAAIRSANEAIAALPAAANITLANSEAVHAARAKVTTAKNLGAVDADFPELSKLLAAEARIAKLAAIKAADDAIDKIPPIYWTMEPGLTLADKPLVVEARRLVNVAKTDHGAVDADFDNLEYLVAAEAMIAKLEAIKAADDAILALPSVDSLTLADKPRVEAARALVNRAKTNHGAVDADFVYLSRLVAAENKIRDLEKRPTPPTGGIYYLTIGGLLILVISFLALTGRRRVTSR